ncbi:microtubule-associated tumor suppressor 1 homolog isoform X2 [Scyliorhinus torazame]|uniref:microtubule-associated tumor suppressor 1 homolog isoform X2 n=1 Tax=Scyliorhinus torazame TaxID=75743 RepID=UPI003B598C4C
MKSSLFKMSYQANNSCRMGESSGNEIESNFRLPLLINDPNGNRVPGSPGIPPETIHVTTPLTNGNCECPDTQIFSFNIGVDVKKAVSDQVACRLHGIYRPELEMTPDYFCDRETSVVMDSQSSSSDYQHKTANLSWSSKCSAVSIVPGQRMLDHKQNYLVKSQFPCRKASRDYLATDIEGTLNTCVKNEAHLQKSLGHHVRGDGVKLSIIDSPNDTVMRITMNMERNLGYSMLPSESKLEIKHGNVDSKQHESNVSILESSVFYNESDSSFESQGENEVLNATQIVYQLPLETNLNSKECTVRVSHQQYARDEAEKILSQMHSHDQSTGPIQYPTTFNPDKNFREEAGHNITDNADFYPCVKYQPKETDGQIPVINEQFEEIRNKMALTEMNQTEAYETPTNSVMNTTFIVLKEVNNDTKSEMNSCRSEAQKLEAEISIQGTVNDETFSVSSPPTVHEHENSYQTSTPSAGSQKMFFASSPLHNLTDLSEAECDSSAEESPTIMVLQSEDRDSVQKPGFKIKFNANMKPKVEIKSYPKPNFNNVKPKVVSRTQQTSSVSKGSVCRPTEASSKYSPRSTNFISSLDSPCSRSLVPTHRKEPLSKSTLKTKSNIVKIQKIAFRKRLSANEPQTLGMTENRTSKSSCGSKPRTRASSVSAFADGAQSSLHFTKPLPPSLGTGTCEHKMFQSDGIDDVNPSRKTFSAIEKPKARCSSLADAVDVHPVSVALENPHATQVTLTKPSPNIGDVQVEQRPRSSTRSQTVPSPSAKLRVSSSVSKLRLGSVNNDDHIGKMHGSTNKQPLISDKQKDASIKSKPIKSKPRAASVTAALNLGASKNTPGSKLPVPASRLQRVNSLSSVSSGVSIQSVQSTCSNKSAVASTNRGGDGPRKGVITATSRSIQTPCTKTLQKNKVVSVKTPCRGVNRNATTSSQNIPGSTARPARQLSISHLKADRTWVKSCSSTQKPSSRTTRAATRTPSDLLPVVKKSPGLPHFKAKCEKQVEWIALLKELLKTSNQRFEAVAIVLQYLQAQREEVGKQHNELSQELLTLRGELESRNVTFVQLEKDREELRNKYEGVIEKLSEEHQTELEGLEKRLEELFTAEKEHLQQNFNNDVKKLQAQLQKEIEGLTSTHETLKLELSATHSKNLECLQNEYQQSLAELVRSHELEQKTLEESFKERQSLLQDQIRELNEENVSLKEEIKAKEEVSKARGQKDQKIDPLSLYLKQELESLKAVLEIKNEKIHNQERKLMQMEKLTEKRTVLDEKLKIVVQENEDLKARMDKHKAVSRQLSTEQVVLQESLQKESKANKRLSMENEELLWKLHNGDVLGLKKLSPTSSLSFQPSNNLVPSSSNPAPSPR